jgi:hypothetical protein
MAGDLDRETRLAFDSDTTSSKLRIGYFSTPIMDIE